MFTPGALIPFRVYLSHEKSEYREFFLKYLETDELGIKMMGGLPRLWEVKKGAVFGPSLIFGEVRFTVAKVDKKKRFSWLVSCCDEETEMASW